MSFKEDVKKFAKITGDNIATVMKTAGIEIFKSVTNLSPVDTGRARASWNMSINEINLAVKPPGEYGPHLEFPSFEGFEFKNTIYISNNLNYIEYLERGSSSQAPRGMLAISVRNYKRYIKEAVNSVNR